MQPAMNPFDHLATVLTRMHRTLRTTDNESPQGSAAKTTRTGTIRDLLKSEARAMTAAEIAFSVDLPSFNTSLVYLLLKNDIKKGSVIAENGKYRWCFEYDSEAEQDLRAAEKLLRKHGYAVSRPGRERA